MARLQVADGGDDLQAWRVAANIFYYYLLTAIGLLPGGIVTKIARTYKKWAYIARKQNIQLTKNQQV
jgi:hypothetical protein